MITKKLDKLTSRLIDHFSSFLSPLEFDLEEKSKRTLSMFMVIFTSPVLLIFSVLHLKRADYFLGVFLLSAGLGLAVSFALLRRFKSVIIFSRINIIFVGLLFLYLLAESARFNKKQFAIGLANTDNNGADIVVERLKGLIQNHLSIGTNNIFANGGLQFGTAVSPSDTNSLELLME